MKDEIKEPDVSASDASKQNPTPAQNLSAAVDVQEWIVIERGTYYTLIGDQGRVLADYYGPSGAQTACGIADAHNSSVAAFRAEIARLKLDLGEKEA